MLALHRMRQQLVRFRVMQVNQLRGLLHEFGVVLPQGRRASIKAANDAMASLAHQSPAMPTDSRQDQLSRLLALDVQIQRIEQGFTEWRRGDEACCRISEIPGIGLLTATAAVRAGIQVRSRICRLSWPGAATEQLGWPSQARWHWQTRRRLPVYVARSRRTSGHIEFKTCA